MHLFINRTISCRESQSKICFSLPPPPPPSGADSATVSEEFKHTQTTITIVTAGRLLSELQDGKVTFKPITLLLLDEASGIHHETALQDLVQVTVLRTMVRMQL